MLSPATDALPLIHMAFFGGTRTQVRCLFTFFLHNSFLSSYSGLDRLPWAPRITPAEPMHAVVSMPSHVVGKVALPSGPKHTRRCPFFYLNPTLSHADAVAQQLYLVRLGGLVLAEIIVFDDHALNFGLNPEPR